MSILALPAELLEKIVIEAGYGNYQAIRLTCRVLCDVATPFVFENLHINLRYIESNRSKATAFLKELSRGRQLARFVRVIHFQSFMMHNKPNLTQLWGAISLFKKEPTFYRTVCNLLLAAVPLMQSLERFHWAMYGRVSVDWAMLRDVVYCISTLPRIRSVSISAGKIKQSIPCASFHHLTSLHVRGRGTIVWVPSIIANSPNLFELRISAFRYDHPSPSHFPVLSLFGAFPEGVQSSLYIIRLSGNYFSLNPSTVPALIPHLRNLSDFDVPIGFEIPDEFWMSLLADMIYIPCVSCSGEGLGDSLLTYLGSYQGLQEITLWPGEPNADDERRSLFLVHHILPINWISLTRVIINPGYAGHWCLDAPMHHSLALCTNLEYIDVCIDEERAQVTGSDNVVVKLMKSLKWWPFLRTLKIEAVVNIEAGKYVHQHEPPRRDVCARVHKLVTACRYKDPSPQMLDLRIYTDLAYCLQLRYSSLPSEGYSFFQTISLIRASGY
ncbi:hypothetical protein ARMSODRAFT_1085715 [Armillaria solidipes]|uniref:F-box domain-containing protein n=1 Tax=Armillaria solidipes TaxID=1076256 RepID=A0A2H3BU60_9AGAR|nr:hypothetical protein ARMSODRAFT_1085715 [Armillaria solidipes]